MENQNTNNAGGMPEMAAALLHKLTGLNAEFSFDFDNLELQVPGSNGPDNRFRLNGKLRVRTSGTKTNQ